MAGLYPVDTGTAQLVADRDDPDRWTVFVNGVPSSTVHTADPLDLSAFEYLDIMGRLLDGWRPLRDRVDAVHVGGAGCALPRRVAASRPRSRQVVFEIDAALVELVRAAFDLAHVPGLKIRVGDGADGVAGLATGSWDLLVRDAFAGTVTPAHLTGDAFLGEVARVLRPDGLYLANIADRPPLTLARREVATARARFAHVALVSEPGLFRGRHHANLVLAASAAVLPVQDWTRSVRGGVVPNRLLSGDGLEAFTAGAKPIDAPRTPDPATSRSRER